MKKPIKPRKEFRTYEISIGYLSFDEMKEQVDKVIQVYPQLTYADFDAGLESGGWYDSSPSCVLEYSVEPILGTYDKKLAQYKEDLKAYEVWYDANRINIEQKKLDARRQKNELEIKKLEEKLLKLKNEKQ